MQIPSDSDDISDNSQSAKVKGKELEEVPEGGPEKAPEGG